jgi:hypothetical protein
VSDLFGEKVTLSLKAELFNMLSTWRSTGIPPRFPQANFDAANYCDELEALVAD